jgi:hypothetical protein
MKMSIYAGPPLLAALDESDRTGCHGNRSSRINSIAERYLHIVDRDCPALSEAQWCAICDALNGYWIDAGDIGLGVRLAWAEVEDADRLNGLGKKWGIDATALARRLRDGTAGEQVAIAEVVQRFWRRSELPAKEALIAAGAKIEALAVKPIEE